MKRIHFFIALLFIPIFAFGNNINKQTKTYAIKEDIALQMDIYRNNSTETQPCLLFAFGGGFKEGKRDSEQYQSYFNFFAKQGFTVVSIDYRLGMKGVKAGGMKFVRAIQHAIGIAVEDTFTATNYLIRNADKLNIDTEKIIISGSSAGAMTVLQADYEKRNNYKADTILPKKFQYAGVISFAGAIFSTHGFPSYKVAPAPTLFFHGSADKLVPYNKIKIFKLGMFGSKWLAKHYKKEEYPYLFYSMQNIGHDVATYPIKEFQKEVLKFIQDYVFEQKPLMIDVNLYDKERKSNMNDSPGDYY